MMIGVLCLAVSSCQKKEILEFGGQMDQFTATDADGQKTYLGHAEEWIYWEAGDQIKVDDGSNKAVCTLISGANTLDAFFKSTTPVNTEASPLYAVYPEESFGTSATDLIFPAEQQYRQNSNGTHPDSSFGRGALPMVAYSDDGMAHHGTLYFHVVAGILRVQILSSELKTIEWIKFKEVGGDHGSSNKQISGHFTVNSIDRNMPWLTANGGATPSDADRTIKITDVNQTVGPTQLLTFYLPLPAVGVSSANEYTQYSLQMTIRTTDNKYFTRDFKADIHRRNITMMRAIQVKEWANSEGVGSDSDVKLVGSGTKDRPFQIYTGKELGMLRDIYNNGGTINGQTIKGYTPSAKDEATYIKIVRSDIELLNSTEYAALSSDERNNPNSRFVEWTTGIENFRGYMYFASSTATNGGITNRSNAPLFESIETDGFVNRVYVKSKQRDAATDVAVTPTVADGHTFSPMCNINNGTMMECHNKCKVTITTNANLVGLCVTNNGHIIGGANEGVLTTEGNVAGICYNNNGEIQGNFTLSLAIPSGANIAGIAFNNNSGGLVRDCLVSSNIPVTSTGNWGVMVYNNNTGATIDNCTSTGTIVYTIDGSVGGICNVNSGTVKNSTNNVEIRGAQGNVGGVVATMNDASAEVYNCCTKAPFLTGAISGGNVADNCGGIVGQLLKGVVYNCYNASQVTGATNSGGMIGNLANDAEADVQNCWSAQGQGFVGKYEEGASVGAFCFSATAAATKCNRIARTNVTIGGVEYNPYEIIEMRDELNPPDQSLGNYVDPELYEAQDDGAGHYTKTHCGVALNKWVEWRGTQSDSRQYYTWTWTENNTRPVFNTGMPGGKSRRK